MRIALSLCALILAVAAGGCQLLNDQAAIAKGGSPLRPVRASRDSVRIEVVWARCDLNDAELNDMVWNEIDETQVEPAVHRELARNGFRVGVVSATPPDAIARLLNMDAATSHYQPNEHGLSSLDLGQEASIHGSRRNLRRGERMEIRASENLPMMPLLVCKGRDLHGRTLRDAQAIYSLQIDPQPDQTVRVELTPEVHFGPSQMRWTGGDDGIDVVLRQLPMREREVFDSMRLGVRLAPGEMLVLAGLPDSGSRPGHYFHTAESVAGREQKIMLIRLAQVPESDTFAAIAK
jgi:hypothetical protein